MAMRCRNRSGHYSSHCSGTIASSSRPLDRLAKAPWSAAKPRGHEAGPLPTHPSGQAGTLPTHPGTHRREGEAGERKLWNFESVFGVASAV